LKQSQREKKTRNRKQELVDWALYIYLCDLSNCPNKNNYLNNSIKRMIPTNYLQNNTMDTHTHQKLYIYYKIQPLLVARLEVSFSSITPRRIAHSVNDCNPMRKSFVVDEPEYIRVLGAVLNAMQVSETEIIQTNNLYIPLTVKFRFLLATSSLIDRYVASNTLRNIVCKIGYKIRQHDSSWDIFSWT